MGDLWAKATQKFPQQSTSTEMFDIFAGFRACQQAGE